MNGSVKIAAIIILCTVNAANAANKFIQALEKRDEEKALALLQSSPRWAKEENNGNPPLRIALRNYCSFELMKSLIDNGAPIKNIGEARETALTLLIHAMAPLTLRAQLNALPEKDRKSFFSKFRAEQKKKLVFLCNTQLRLINHQPLPLHLMATMRCLGEETSADKKIGFFEKLQKLYLYTVGELVHHYPAALTMREKLKGDTFLHRAVYIGNTQAAKVALASYEKTLEKSKEALKESIAALLKATNNAGETCVDIAIQNGRSDFANWCAKQAGTTVAELQAPPSAHPDDEGRSYRKSMRSSSPLKLEQERKPLEGLEP